MFLFIVIICGVGLAVFYYIKRKIQLQEKLLKEEEESIRQEENRRILEEIAILSNKEEISKIKQAKEMEVKRKQQKARQREEKEKRILEQKEREEKIKRAIEENEISDHPASYVINKEDYKRGNTIENEYRKQWFLTLIGIYDNKCARCQNQMNGIEIDHFVLSKNAGGNFILKHRDGYLVNNAIPLCAPCNRSKGDRDYKLFFTKPQLAFIFEKNTIMTRKINDSLISNHNYKKKTFLLLF